MKKICLVENIFSLYNFINNEKLYLLNIFIIFFIVLGWLIYRCYKG